MDEKPLSASELRKRGFDRAADALERKQIEEYYLYDLRGGLRRGGWGIVKLRAGLETR